MCILVDECVSFSICLIQPMENVQEFSFKSILIPDTGEEPYQCYKCDKWFIQESKLM